VEKINGPLLLISGKADTMWPSTPMCEQIISRLSANSFPFPYRHEALECGHGVGMAETFWPLVNGFIKENFI